MPAQQGFCANNLPIVHIDDGLISQPKFIVFKSVAQFMFDLQTLMHAQALLFCVYAISTPAPALGFVHCRIGMLDQRIDIRAVPRINGNAHRRCDL